MTTTPETAPPLTGLRVRMRMPDGWISSESGVVAHLSPCKAYPEFWPLAEWCGHQHAAAERALPVVGAEVHWDAYVSAKDGALVMLPGYLESVTWVQDARWLTDVAGEPVAVPPLIERLTLSGALL